MKLRVARHTASIDSIIHFYCDILGLSILGRFKDHDGYNGVFIGEAGVDWHLEFTTSQELPDHKADDDDALVFYAQNGYLYGNITHAPGYNPMPDGGGGGKLSDCTIATIKKWIDSGTPH